jgi:hypothetical protein
MWKTGVQDTPTIRSGGRAMNFWTYRRRFIVAGRQGEARIIAKLQGGLESTLLLDGVAVSADRTPPSGPEAVRNHRLTADLPEGPLDVEAGYVNWTTIGVAVRLNGVVVHESHPGRAIAFPSSMRGMAENSKDPGEHFRRNGPALAVDIGLGLLFFGWPRSSTCKRRP